MASEIPVLPLVGSRIVSPGLSFPSFSALSIIEMAARSLMDPVGLWSSSLAQSRTSAVGDRLGRPTRGVPPRESTSEAKRAMGFSGRRWGARGYPSAAARDRREDRHRVAVLDRGVQSAGEPDVLVVDVDVDEPVQLALVGDQAVLQTGVLAVEVVDERAEGAAAALDGLRATGVGAQDGRDPDLDGHGSRVLLGRSWVPRAGGRRSGKSKGGTPRRRGGFRTARRSTPSVVGDRSRRVVK